MCLIAIAFRARPDLTLLVAANRDELHARPTAAATFWDESPAILAGRDLQSGGTWMGVTRGGRFAAITNFRDPSERKEHAPSRGLIVRRFLESSDDALKFSEWIRREAAAYAGFGLFYFDGTELGFFSNRSGEPRVLRPGIYGLSNHLLDTDWPKVRFTKATLERELAEHAPSEERILAPLRDTTASPDSDLPDTGVGLDRERLLSPVFISNEIYGTRSSTVLTFASDGHARFTEVRFEPSGVEAARTTFEFNVSA